VVVLAGETGECMGVEQVVRMVATMALVVELVADELSRARDQASLHRCLHAR